MKIFPDAAPSLNLLRYATVFLILLALQSCATHKLQLGKQAGKVVDDFSDAGEVSHTFYLIGDAGNWDEGETPPVLAQLSEHLKAADTASTLIFLGDNIYPHGLPKFDAPDYLQAKKRLENQLRLTDGFNGKTVFIPGNHDYYSGLQGLKDQAKMVTEYTGDKKSFLPRKGCAIEHRDINGTTALIVVDSEWYLQDWDDLPSINEDCEIRTRELFFTELDSKLNDYQNKTVILAMHHPLMSNGAHGGEYSVRKQLFPFSKDIPLPVVGSVINLLRKTSGLSPEDLQNKKYNTFLKRVKALIQDMDNVIVVSGHDHSLQYIDYDNIKQVISGSGSKTEAARAINPRDFSYGGNGFAELKVLRNGATRLSYFAPASAEPIFVTQPVLSRPKPNIREFAQHFGKTKDTSVYTVKMTTKGGAYKFFWGQHYRRYYSMMIRANQATIDTLYGGLKPVKAGGGNQSRSLRLEDKDGREYVMRALRKSATRFLQSAAFKDQAVEKDFRNTYTESFLMDFYTTAHPYAAFVVADLSEDLKILHTNPQLLYIPKQNPLELYNEEFGDELYLVEERPMDKFKDRSYFGKPDDIVSTDDVLANLRSDSKYEVDQKSWIRARMFDMLIGDWDRHSDQWRWAEFRKKDKDKVVYKPIPRDRDQAFTKIDGALLSILMNIPALRHMKKFNDDLRNVKWFNRTAYDMDLRFVPMASEDDWIEQARYIEEHLSDEEIDKAFLRMPEEVRDGTVEKIKAQLKTRRTHLVKYARKYYKVLQRTAVIVGTDKRDRLWLTRSGRETRAQVFRIRKDGSEEQVFDKVYRRPTTKEIWVYGLNGNDSLVVKGLGGWNKIRLRLIGGGDVDTYVVEGGKRVKIYDFQSKNNDLLDAGNSRLTITDDYDLNTYDYKKPIYNVFAGYPLGGFNPDDGVKLGGIVNYTVNGFERNPFSQKHSLLAQYFFATNGFELGYRGSFPKAIGNWTALIDARYTSPNFSQNFFGLGNETENNDDYYDFDYNRVKMRMLKLAPSLVRTGSQGTTASVQLSFERISVDETPNRFISTPGVVDPRVFDYQNFIDLNGEYRYDNYDNVSNPKLGFTFSIKGGFKYNFDEASHSFPYAESGLGITYKLTPHGKFVLATFARTQLLFNDDYEFYQAATVGGDSDLRGFRNQRFSGQRSFYQSSDIRWNLGKFKTSIAPLRYGVLAGFDYGRVWLKDEFSDKWHQSAGCGIWVNGVNLITARITYFVSGDGGRLFGGLGFGF